MLYVFSEEYCLRSQNHPSADYYFFVFAIYLILAWCYLIFLKSNRSIDDEILRIQKYYTKRIIHIHYSLKNSLFMYRLCTVLESIYSYLTTVIIWNKTSDRKKILNRVAIYSILQHNTNCGQFYIKVLYINHSS